MLGAFAVFGPARAFPQKRARSAGRGVRRLSQLHVSLPDRSDTRCGMSEMFGVGERWLCGSQAVLGGGCENAL